MAYDASILKGVAAGDPSEWTRERERSASGAHSMSAHPSRPSSGRGAAETGSFARRSSAAASATSSSYAAGESDRDRERRTKSKRLATIFEEHGREFTVPRSDGELETRRREAERMRYSDVMEVVMLLRLARNADLCFVIDATGSMDPYITEVKNVIGSIVDSLTRPHGSSSSKLGAGAGLLSSMRIACVAYRDYCDGDERLQVLDFTADVSQFRAFLRNVTARGGGDGAEDVLGALDRTRSLRWSRDSGVKQIFHIADAPAHGTKFHSGRTTDDFPYGHPNDPPLKELFEWINLKEIFYVFGKINDITDHMIEVFASAAGKRLETFNVKNPGRIEEAVVASVTSSVDTVVARSKTSAGKVKDWELRKYTIDKSMPDWSALPLQEGRLQSYKMPDSIEDIVNDKPLAKYDPKKTSVKIAHHPFAEGAERIAYYGLDVTKHGAQSEPVPVVFKEFKRIGKGMNSANKYELVNQMQTVASFMAFEFTKALKSARVAHPVEMKFLKVKTFAAQMLTDKYRFMTCERKFREGDKFIRFSNNAGYSLLEEKARACGIDPQFVAMVLAFSHWTHEVTRGKLMIVDLEGIVTHNKTRKAKILLTDPAIHCTDLDRFGNLNHGEPGMSSFFETHECNHVCAALHLSVHGATARASSAASVSASLHASLSRLSIH